MKTLLVAWVAILCFFGCRTVRDNRAYARVISHPTLAERTYRTLAITHPCANTYVMGKDSIVYDTIQDFTALNASNKTVDSLLNKLLNPTTVDTEYVDVDSIRAQIYKEFNKGKQPTVIHITKTRIDTVTDTRQAADLATDVNNLKGQNFELDKQVASLKKANTHKSLYLGGAVLVFILGIYLRIKRVI